MAKSATRMRFEQAFRDARNSGEKTFEFEGKSYSTRMAGDGGASKKSAPLPPTRDVPREDDPEKSFTDYPDMKTPPAPMRRPSGDAGAAPVGRRSMFERMPNPYDKESPGAVQGPEKPPTTGRLRTVGGNMAETNAGYPSEKPMEETAYRKGGMVKKKSGGMMKKKSGGSVRGAGAAQRGQGKMRMC